MHAILAGVGQQFHLGSFVQADTIFQFDLLNVLRRVRRGREIALSHHGGLLDETVFHRPRQRIVHDHILERNRPWVCLHKRRRRHFQTEQWFEFVDRPHSGLRPVAVRFVHQQHEVRQARQMVEIAVAQHFFHAFNTRLAAATHFGIDLGDIEDVDAHVVGEAHRIIVNRRAGLVVVVAGDNQRRLLRKLGNAPEHVLWRIAGEIRNQLVVNRQVRREHEKIVDAMRQMEVSDESAHQPRFADTGRQRKAQRGKFTLEVFQRGELRLERGQYRRDIPILRQHLRRGIQCLFQLGQ